MTARPDTGARPMAEEAWAALGTVRDPELDEPITDLGFVTELLLADDGVAARLRLPTYFCAPNFAYIMVADAHDALSALPGRPPVTVRLEDHFAAEEINAGVAGSAGFAGSFPDEAQGELGELRETFRRKAHLAALERVCRQLIEDGWQPGSLGDAVLADVPDTPALRSLLRRRDELGLPTGRYAPLLVEADGSAVPPGDIEPRLRFARAVRVSIDGNAGFCRGLLHTRYPAEEESTS